MVTTTNSPENHNDETSINNAAPVDSTRDDEIRVRTTTVRNGSRIIAPEELDENSAIATQPPALSGIRLKRHQLALLHRCHMYETKDVRTSSETCMHTSAGIMGDKAGSGKSFVILALVLSHVIPVLKPMCSLHALDTVHITRQKSSLERFTDIKTNLLVIPHNLCMQWTECIRNTINDENGVSYSIINRMHHVLRILDMEIGAIDLLVVTSTFYNDVVDILNAKRLRVRRVIYDEADSVKISRCGYVHYRFAWFVTASYTNMITGWNLNSTGYIKEWAGDVHSSLTRVECMSLVVRNKDCFVDSCFPLPEMKNTVIFCKTPYVIDILHGNIDEALMERLNADDLAGAMQCLDPNRMQSQKNIVNMLIRNYVQHLHAVRQRIYKLSEKLSRITTAGNHRIIPHESMYSSSSCRPTTTTDTCENEEEECLDVDEDVRRGGEGICDHHDGVDPPPSDNEETRTSRISSTRNNDSSCSHSMSSNNHDTSNNMDHDTVRNKYQQIDGREDTAHSRSHIETRIRALRQEEDKICCRITSIQDRISTSGACGICYGELNTKTITSCCSNAYCFKCINIWLSSQKKTCPTCKSYLDMSRLLVVRNEDDAGGASCSSSFSRLKNHATTTDGPFGSNPDDSKLDNFEKIVQNLNRLSRKILVFSNYDTSLDKIHTILDRQHISHAMLKGHSGRISKVLDLYRKGTLNVLLVNATAYGSGMNLQNTTDIVMFHKLNDEIENQVLGRAQRGGRTDPLNVWYLLHTNESQHRDTD